jgi:hypothetical protein
MATLRREWVSVEQAQQWVDTYDPQWVSPQIVDAMASEMQVGRNMRWHHAIIVDTTTRGCHKGLKKLRAIVRAQHAQMCWVARAGDFHASEGDL